MTEEAKATASIHELSYDFGCRITRLFQYLTEDSEYKEYVQSKQIYRSGTSIGANVRESKHAQSEADFLSKMSIAYKEADEVMEQREQSEACFDFAESRQNSTIVKPISG
jgi:four helix bundle protein